jgi:hypothetical protein
MTTKISFTHRALRLALLQVIAWFLPLHAHAFITGNMNCSVSGYPANGYTFQAGADMKVAFRGTCTVIRVFPYGAATNLQITNVSGAYPARLQVLDPYNNMYLVERPLGSYGASCLGGACNWLAVGSSVSYTYYVVGKAPNTAGTRIAQVNLGITASGYPSYAEWIHPFTFKYNVSAVSCALSSPSVVNLNFGTVNSAQISSSVQRTDISINCPSSMRAAITLTPTQSPVDASRGLSRTTLPGLNMQAFWTEQMEPVNFSTFGYKYLKAGSNSVGFSFKPVLEGGQSASGAFQSQYTLNISYQ